MNSLIIPEGYRSSLDVLQTQKAIKQIKDFFQENLAKNLHLTRISAPLFVRKNTGINDNLSGVEQPVSFQFNDGDQKGDLEIVQSLAKWKRIALKNYHVPLHEGIYADMDAIRPDEILDNIHSLYVDQWDWEKIIAKEDRHIDYLKDTVRSIFDVFVKTQKMLEDKYPKYQGPIQQDLTFFTTQELEDRYPTLTPSERETTICKEYGAVFIIGIGKKLRSGKPHDSRSPDYDDWDLNGDLLLWNPILNAALELTSMGIRVDKNSLLSQLEESGQMDRLELTYHQMLFNEEIPLTIGGGIGQSRICMFFLQKAHIGEVQSSAWPKDMRIECEKNDIHLL